MTVPLSVCALCLKHVSGGGGSSGGGGGGGVCGGELQRILILLGRILKTDKLKISVSTNKQFAYFCNDCGLILDSLATCYEQMKALELRVEWNLWKLRKLASFAARVPSRVAAATEVYTRDGRVDELEAVRGWRSIFLRKCTLKLSTRFPKVKLARIQQESHHPQLAQSIITEESKSAASEATNNKNKAIFESKDVVGEGHSDIGTPSRGQITDDDDDGYEDVVQEVSPDIKLELALADPPVATATGAGPHQELQVIISSSQSLVKTDPDPPPTGGAPLNVDYDNADGCGAGVQSSPLTFSHSIFPEVVVTTALSVGQEGEGDSSETIQERPPDDDDTVTNQLSSTTTDSRLLRASLQCSSCSKTFSTVDNLKAHESSSHKNSHSSPVHSGKVELANCDDGEEEEEEEEEHQNRVDSDSDFEVPIADADDSDEDEEELENELRSDSEEDDEDILNSGDEHGRRRRRSTLRSKEPVGRRSTNNKVQICSICTRRIRGGPWKYKRHYIKHHQMDGVEEPSQIQHCEVDQCSAYFLTELQLQTHQRLEHGERRIRIVKSKKNAFQKPENPHTGRYSKFFNFEMDSACKLCHKVFLTPELTTQHAKNFHGVEPGPSSSGGGGDNVLLLFSCKVDGCSTHCPSGALLQEHMERVHQADLAPSLVPSLSAPAPGVLPPSFLESREQLGSRTCDVCQLVFKRTWDYKQHFKAYHEVAGLEGEGEGEVKRCGEDQCGAYFRTEHQLSLHMIRTHRKAKVRTRDHGGQEQSPEDSEDDEETRSQVGDNNHLVKSKWASKQRLYCPVCPRWYFDNNTRVDHFKNWHDLTLLSSEDSPAAAALSCDQPFCSAYFVDKNQLRTHLEEAHQLKDPSGRVCDDCGKLFRHKWQLNQHRARTHDKHLVAKVHACSIAGCGKTFALSRDRRKHERRVHEGWKRKKEKKPLESLVCDVCGKSVRGCKFHLELHKLTHSGQDSYPFQCATCGKKFTSKGNLDRHCRTHSQEKPYVCQYCGKGFAHDNLRRHVRMNHPDKVPRHPPSRRSSKT